MMLWQAFGCRKARRQIQSGMDGALESSSFLDRHLDSCPECRSYREETVGVRTLLPAWKAPRPSPDFADRAIEAYLSSREKPQAIEFPAAPRSNPFALHLAAAAGVLFLLGFAYLFSPKPLPPANVAAGEPRARSIGRAEIIDSHRDVNLLGMAFPARPGLSWNFR